MVNDAPISDQVVNPNLVPPIADVSHDISIAEVMNLARNANNILHQIRDKLLAPHPRKLAPTFSAAKVAELCGITKPSFVYHLGKGNFPEGTSTGPGKRRDFTLEEAIQCVQVIKKDRARPEDRRGRIFIVGNFKGGVGKSTTAVAVAQALTLRGRKVLLIDSDAQGTATQLCGFAPEAEIEPSQTLLPAIYEDGFDLTASIQKTYWHNLDLIAASPQLYDAEFQIPARVSQDKGYQFWDVLRRGLVPLTKHYDALVIDTSPSLGYLSLNGLLAADGLLMPSPPEALDFASSVQFWSLFSDLAAKLPGVAEKKRYDFISVLPTKVRSAAITDVVKHWMRSAYGKHMMSLDIPSSEVPSGASAKLSTVFDLIKPIGSIEAYRRFKEPMDQLADYLDDQLVSAWKRSTE